MYRYFSLHFFFFGCVYACVYNVCIHVYACRIYVFRVEINIKCLLPLFSTVSTAPHCLLLPTVFIALLFVVFTYLSIFLETSCLTESEFTSYLD